MSKSNSLIIFIALVVIGLVSYFGIFPLGRKVKAQKMELKKAEDILIANEEKLTDLREIFQNLSTYQQIIDLMSIAIPDTEQIPEIHLQLRSLASKAKLDISSLEVETKESASEEPQSAGLFSEINFKLGLKGGYNELLSFFESARKNLRPITIKSLAISPDEKLGVSATFSLAMPYRKGE